MRRYPEYKESGVEFTGEIPKTWHLTKLKYIARIDNSGLWGEEQGILDIDAPVSTTAHLTRDGDWLIEQMPIRSFSKADYEYYSGKNEEIIIVKSSGSATNIITGKAGFIDNCSKGIVFSNFLMRVKPNREKYEPKFLYYFLTSFITKERIKRMVSATTYPNLKVEEYISNLIPIPSSKDEQVQIVNFLDRKTKQIDELIRIKERRIELLQEQRTALINQVVTKGFDPNVEMKPSGVEWIGEIPRHWNLSMLKYTARLVYGDTLISENRQNGVVPVYGSNGIIDTHSSANTLSPAIIVGRKGSLGKIQYSDVLCFVIDTAYFIDRRTSHVNLRWLYYVLHALKLERFRNSVLPGLNRKDTEGQYVPLITAAEQDRIANFLDRKTQQIDELITAERRKIELLKEYRQSLISEVVTGKIDVRNEV